MKGYSLHIGLNYIDPMHYGGWDGKLNACEYDAHDMESIAKSLGYSTKTLIREEATRKNVIEKIENYSKLLKSGDILYISYSGHGGQTPDLDNDEMDAQDETWCLYDGQLIDDELHYLWSLFKENVRVLVTSDSCHSGTILKSRNSISKANKSEEYLSKNLPSEITTRTYYKNIDFYSKVLLRLKNKSKFKIKASIKLISGCQEDQLSYDGTFNGVFTAHLKKVWNGGKFKNNYEMFCNKIRKSINDPEQIPKLTNLGKRMTKFDKQTPFQIV
ncbi:caspase family protein [Pseudotenacibaculum haliotis]|uniref:Caspase family protein n=1 Tax=Pseudotenacibaculum haliotis TaxID=1862138 RepID=A0ABW5LSE0_9FLAO